MSYISTVPDQAMSLQAMLASKPIQTSEPSTPPTDQIAPADNRSFIQKGIDTVVSDAEAFNYGVESNPINRDVARIGASILGPSIVQAELGVNAAGKELGIDALSGHDDLSLHNALLSANWDAIASPLMRSITGQEGMTESGFNPIAMIQEPQYARFAGMADQVVGMNSQAEVLAWMRTQDAINQEAQSAAEHPVFNFLGANLGDLTNVAVGAGLTAVTGGALGAAVGAGMFGLQAATEAELMKSYADVQNRDVVSNALTGAAMGALFGSLAGKLNSRSKMQLNSNFSVPNRIEPAAVPEINNLMKSGETALREAEMKFDPINPTITPPELAAKFDESIKAAAVASKTIDVSDPFSNISPITEDIYQPSASIRKSVAQIHMDNLMATPAEQLKPYEKAMIDAVTDDYQRDILKDAGEGNFPYRGRLENLDDSRYFDQPSLGRLIVPVNFEPRPPLDVLKAEMNSIMKGDAYVLDSVKMGFTRDGRAFFNPADIGC